MNELAAAIDIGSSKVCTIIGELGKNNQLQILGVGTADCKGLKKGIIVDIDDAVEAIRSSIEQAERMSDMKIESAFINIAGGRTTLIKNRGVIAVSREDREITTEDVGRVLQEAKIVEMPVDMEVIGSIPIQFIVDGYENIKDPVGMIGVRLEVEAYIITTASATVQNLIKSVERCGVKVSGIVIDPLAASEVVLTRDEKELGMVLADVGGEITDISIFKGNSLVYTTLIPVGGSHMTNDISIGLKIPVSEAEELKRRYGYASVSMLKSVENIAIGGPGKSRRTVTNHQLTDIIEARLQEIYCLINNKLKESGYKDSIVGGIVITGGGLSFIKGSLDEGTAIIGLPMRIGSPKYIGVASPIYSTGTGMVKYILVSRKYDMLIRHAEDEVKRGRMSRLKNQVPGNSPGFIDKIKEFFTDFF